jgi:ubiquinone/menaquinone biosynthesis C-methylase UbiE
MPFKTLDEKEIKRLNRLQRERFDKLVDMFEPPLQDGVPERLERIVAAAEIRKGEVVLDVGTGTGILMPFIQKYRPGCIYACDLSDEMLKRLRNNYSGIQTILADVRDLTLPDVSVHVVFINACYPNIVDKAGAFKNIARMMIAAGRLIISHPLGKRFVDRLRRNSAFPFDDFPEKSDAEKLFAPYGFRVESLLDEPELYILNISRRPPHLTIDN